MPTSTIVIVGAGPRGTGLLERLAAGAPELHPDGLDVHLVDPYPPGAGRIWRHAQSPLLAMNSMAADVTMYTDDVRRVRGPDRARPVVLGLGADRPRGRARAGRRAGPRHPHHVPQPSPAERLPGLGAAGRASRDCPAGMRVHLHRTRATGLTEDGDTQIVHLEGRPPLRADAVVLASGHLDATPTADERDLAARAAAAGLRYLPPEQTTDTDLSVLAPGETVLVRGLGLAFIDLDRAALRGSRRPVRARRVTGCATCRPGRSPTWWRARRGAPPTTPRPTTSCAPGGRRCRASSGPRRSTRCWPRARRSTSRRRSGR